MNHRIKKSLRSSFIDGTFFSVMLGIGDTYFTPFALLLKATAFQVGLLSSLPGLVSSLLQIRTPELTERAGRHRLMSVSVFAQAALWLPIILTPFVFPLSPAPWLVCFVTLYLVSSSLAGPAWSSIMSQYLPRDKRGRYFSWRQRIHGTITLAAMFAAGFFLHVLHAHPLAAFSVLFTVAMACRFMSWYYLDQMYEPPIRPKPDSYFSFYDFLAKTRRSNFAKFTLFVGALGAAVNFASPFFSVYLLKELHYGYLNYVAIAAAPSVATLISLPAWGKYADRVGCVRVMRFTSIVIITLPFLWIFSTYKPYLILVQAVSGFFWAGFNLAAANFIYDAVSEPKRVRCIAYYNLINGVGVFAGATLGGALLSHVPQLFGSSYFTIFLGSGLLRLAVRQFFVPRIKEVRGVETISDADLLAGVILGEENKKSLRTEGSS